MVDGHRHYTDRRMVVTIDQAGPRITQLKAFRIGTGSMRGVIGGAAEMGHLPTEYQDEARDAEYVVYSYQTPIAWITADGQRVVPDIGYSPTTGSHQYVVKNAWRDTDYVGSTFPERGRRTIPAGGGRRTGGMDDDRYPVRPSSQRGGGYHPGGILPPPPVLDRESRTAGFREDWELQGDAFSMQASVASPDLDIPWHLRAPARGAGYPPMGERQG
jgi:hypothetical protein